MRKDMEIPVKYEILEGLYLIMSGVSISSRGGEVYPEAMPSMENAFKFMIEFGHKHNIDCRGGHFKRSK
jgi:hypothetical protein